MRERHLVSIFRKALLALTLCAVASWAQAALFEDDEARKAILALREQMKAIREELGDEGVNLLWLYSSLCNVSFPVEVWRQQRVPDSGERPRHRPGYHVLGSRSKAPLASSASAWHWYSKRRARSVRRAIWSRIVHGRLNTFGSSSVAS